jgi:hypothetical protein
MNQQAKTFPQLDKRSNPKVTYSKDAA